MHIILKFVFLLLILPCSLLAQTNAVSCHNEVQSSIKLSTGIDAEGNLLAPGIGVVDPFWTLTNLPNLSGCRDAEISTLSNRAYVVNFNDASTLSWVNQEGARALSPVDAGLDGRLACRNISGDPFIFDRLFCLRAAAEIDLDVRFKGDDRLQLELVDMATGTVLASSERYVYQNPPLTALPFRVQIGLKAGTYALRAKYENDAVAAGFSVAGQVSMLPASTPPQLSNAVLLSELDCQRTDTLLTDQYYFYPDSALTICVDTDLLPVAESYTYQWFGTDGQSLSAPSSSECFTIPRLHANTTGTYYCQVKPNKADLCYVLPVKVATYVQDPTGAWYIPNQLVVKYRNNTTEREKAEYIKRIQATRLDSCMCLIDLLMLPDTLIDENGNPIVDPEEKKKKAGSEDNAGVETVGWNTIMEEEVLAYTKNQGHASGEKYEEVPDLPAPPRVNGDSVIVALIDTGVDFTDPDFQNYLWVNPDPEPMANDTCKVCITDAKLGYDFGDMDNDPSGENPHGHFVGQAILYTATLLSGADAPQVRIMPLKVMDKKGSITVFSVTCATVFAVRHGAQIINYSMGGYGGFQDILAAALNTVEPGNCAPAVVTSAGNDTLDISIVPHYFSNLRDSLSTVLTINSIDTLPNDAIALAPYSNFGPNVDLAITGDAKFNTHPYTGVQGTSISAGYVSGILAYAFQQKSGISGASAVALLQNFAGTSSAPINLDSPTGLYWKAPLDELIRGLPEEDCSYTLQACIPTVTSTRNLFNGRDHLAIRVIPNPTSGQWDFSFELPQSQRLQISVYDAQGRMVSRDQLFRGAGEHRIPFNLGNEVDGVYIYQVVSEKYMHVGKIIKQSRR